MKRVKSFITPPPPPRVRIAPSPTGPFHLGNARTALFNMLFAREHGGVFVLRIDDTDRERSKKAFEDDIKTHLQWLGLQWDEGVDVGGAFGPYRQSQRGERYEYYLEALRAKELAYLCVCSKEELESIRAAQRKRGEPPRYPGTCKRRVRAEKERLFTERGQALVRLSVEDTLKESREVGFTDLIHGTITFARETLSDFAVAKITRSGSDETVHALYNFAAAVDDADMRITHVLRGEDHISNTPKQILIFMGLELPMPQYGHLPLILGPDKSKLSKRHGATAVHELKELGYFPEAVVNFLALLGWRADKDTQERFSFSELIDAFSLDGVQKSSAIWNPEKLEWLNRTYLSRPQDRWLTGQMLPKSLLSRAASLLDSHGLTIGAKTQLDALLPVVLERTPLTELEQALTEEYRYIFERPEFPAVLLSWKGADTAQTKKALTRAHTLLKAFPEKTWNKEALEELLMQEAETFKEGDRGAFLWPLRVALCGRKRSPSPFELLEILGEEESLDRIETAGSMLKEGAFDKN